MSNNWNKGGIRPEHTQKADEYYNAGASKNYNTSQRVTQIQRELSQRAIDLLDLPSDKTMYLLDVGCGTGMSGKQISRAGHEWVGYDISADMLDIANEKAKGDLLLHDAGQPLRFRRGTFDGAISISAIQWLATGNPNDARRKLFFFFSSLRRCLRKGARCALQFYPENTEEVELISAAAIQCGFRGGIVVDYPNSAKAKKFYLCAIADGEVEK